MADDVEEDDTFVKETTLQSSKSFKLSTSSSHNTKTCSYFQNIKYPQTIKIAFDGTKEQLTEIFNSFTNSSIYKLYVRGGGGLVLAGSAIFLAATPLALGVAITAATVKFIQIMDDAYWAYKLRKLDQEVKAITEYVMLVASSQTNTPLHKEEFSLTSEMQSTENNNTHRWFSSLINFTRLITEGSVLSVFNLDIIYEKLIALINNTRNLKEDTTLIDGKVQNLNSPPLPAEHYEVKDLALKQTDTNTQLSKNILNDALIRIANELIENKNNKMTNDQKLEYVVNSFRKLIGYNNLEELDNKCTELGRQIPHHKLHHKEKHNRSKTKDVLSAIWAGFNSLDQYNPEKFKEKQNPLANLQALHQKTLATSISALKDNTNMKTTTTPPLSASLLPNKGFSL